MKNIEFETAKTYEQIMKEIHNVSERYYNKNTGEMWAFYEEEDYYYLIGDAGFKYSKDVENGTFIPAPFQEEVIEWLLNEHKIFIQIELEQADGRFSYLIFTQTGLSVLYGCAIIGGKHIDRNRAIEMAILDALKLIN